jgi:hypothetical protein
MLFDFLWALRFVNHNSGSPQRHRDIMEAKRPLSSTWVRKKVYLELFAATSASMWALLYVDDAHIYRL